MAGRRVLVSGMGGELGTQVTALLEQEPWVGELVGIDADPPRRRLRRATFHRIRPADRHRIVEVVTDFDPHVLVHLAVWEPNARAGAHDAERLTDEATVSIIGAAAECHSLESIVIRSGVEVYGRHRNSRTRPDEDAPVDPSSPYGRMLATLETTSRDVAARIGVPVTALRLAPVLGPHVPSPLGRLLRMPAVPFSVLGDPPFTVIEASDAARAFVAAAARQHEGALNVVAPGAVTMSQALLRGRRLPIPVIGPEWRLARVLSHLAGAPVPEHVLELTHRGRLADGQRAHEILDWRPLAATSEVVDRLFAWPSVVRTPPRQEWGRHITEPVAS
jgi:UDP-glucose 4-epimerase